MGLTSINRLRRRHRRSQPSDHQKDRNARDEPETASEVLLAPSIGQNRLFSAQDIYRELIDTFYSEKSEHTITAYKQDLRAFAAFRQKDDVNAAVSELLRAPSGDANAMASRWLRSMALAGRSPATRRRRLNTLKSLTRLARIFGLITWQIELRAPKKGDPTWNVEGPKEEKIHKLFTACGEDPRGLRDRLILRLLLRGLRRFEIVGLRLKHYDREERRMWIEGKADRRGWALLHSNLVQCLNPWLDTTGVSDPDDPIIVAFNGRGQLTKKPIGTRGLNHIVTAIGKRAGVKVWPHAFRHSGATIGADEGYTAPEIQSFLRHSSLSMAQTYIDKRADRGSKLAEAIDQKFPIRKTEND